MAIVSELVGSFLKSHSLDQSEGILPDNARTLNATRGETNESLVRVFNRKHSVEYKDENTQVVDINHNSMPSRRRKLASIGCINSHMESTESLTRGHQYTLCHRVALSKEAMKRSTCSETDATKRNI